MLKSTKLGPLASVLLGLTLLGGIASSCSSDDSNEATANCSLGGNACEFGCSASLGCVDCMADSDCEPGAPVCVLGRCVACRVNSDCATGQVCAPANHQCTTGCQTDTDCNGFNNGINNAPYCDAALGACVGCRTATDCADQRPVCDPERRQCSECQSREDCGIAAPACNLQNGNCEECLVDTDCGADRGCGFNHQCFDYCNSNVDCATNPGGGQICNIPTGICVQCTANSDCTNAAAPVCSTENRCVACSANSDCPAATPICDPNPRGGGQGQFGGARCVACNDATPCSDPNLPICNNQGICVAAG